jgi:hypothetical protein
MADDGISGAGVAAASVERSFAPLAAIRQIKAKHRTAKLLLGDFIDTSLAEPC